MLKAIQVNSCYVKTADLRNIQIQNNIESIFWLFIYLAFRRQAAGGRGLEGKK